MSDSSDIDQAIIARLGADVTLLGYCPSGAYWDMAPPNVTGAVIVSLVEPHDESVFGGTAFEDTVYAIKAVIRGPSATANAKAAAARIHDLLHDQALSVAGYTHMAMHRNESPSRIRYTERDDQNPDILWYHRGGYYRVQQALA